MAEQGNIAILHEALENIKKLNRYDLGCIRSKKRRDEFDAKILEIERIVYAALKVPARNCDVGTVEEQLERHWLYCIGFCTVHECSYDLEKHDTETCKKCFAKWAQMPYEAKKEG